MYCIYCPATAFQPHGTTDSVTALKDHSHMPQVATLERAQTTKAVRDECLKKIFTSARCIVETVIRNVPSRTVHAYRPQRNVF